MPRSQHSYPPQTHRGFINTMIPELLPIVQSALECVNIPPRKAQHLTAGSLWMLIYFFDPARVVIERPGLRPFLCPGHSAILITPGTRYSVDTRVNKGPSRHIWMTLDGIQRTPLFSMIAPGKQGRLVFTDPDQILAAHMESLIDATTQEQTHSFWPAHMHGRKILDVLNMAERVSSAECRISKSATAPTVDPIMGRVVGYLQAHLGERITLAALARHVHASPSTVSHRYRLTAGESPMHTLNRLRLLQAKIRLVQGDTVENIAHALGFYDAKHLSNTFRKSEGIPPSAFCRQNLSAE